MGYKKHKAVLPYKQRVTGSNPVAPTLKIKGLQHLQPFFILRFAYSLHTTRLDLAYYTN
jgi:hypothetical protein